MAMSAPASEAGMGIEVEPSHTILAHSGAVVGISFSASGKSFASAGRDKLIRIFNAQTWTEVKSLRMHRDRVNAVCFSPKDESTLASCSKDKTVVVWNTATGQANTVFDPAQKEVRCLAFCADGTLLAAGGDDCVVRIYQINTEEIGYVLKGHEAPILALAFNDHGQQRLLASASEDRTIKVWNLHSQHPESAAPLVSIHGHADAVCGLAFCPTVANVLASCSRDQTVRLWHSDSGEQLCVLRGHKDVVNAVAFDTSGWHLLSASADSTVKVWDVATGVSIRVLKGHRGAVGSCAFSRNSSQAVTGGWDHAIKTWLVNLPDHGEQAPRPLVRSEDSAKKTAGSGTAQAKESKQTQDDQVSVAESDDATKLAQAMEALSKAEATIAKLREAKEEALRELLKTQQTNKTLQTKVKDSDGHAEEMRQELERQKAANKMSKGEIVATVEGLSAELETERQLCAKLQSEVMMDRKRWQLDPSSVKLTAQIGSGPLSNVHTAVVNYGSSVVKQLHDSCESEDDVKAIGDIISLRAVINHANIVNFFGAVLSAYEPVKLAYESMTVSLRRVAALPYRLSCRELVDIGMNIAAALRYLHSRGIAHGRITSSRILLSPDVTAKLSGLLEAECVIAISANPPPAALAEEMVDFNASAPADIYSLGSALVEASIGAAFDPSRSARQFDVMPHEPLRALAMRCLEQNASDRPQAELISTLLGQLQLPGAYPDYSQCNPRRHVARDNRGNISLIEVP